MVAGSVTVFVYGTEKAEPQIGLAEAAKVPRETDDQ